MPRTMLPAQRRRRRSVRVTVAVGCMTVGTTAVVAALPVGTLAPLVVAAVLALACGWAATRIMYSELVQSRRAHARDRAAQARAFRALLADRSTEHTAFAAAMTDRLAARDRELRELAGTLRLSERRAVDAEERVRREARRLNDARTRVAELEVALAIRTAEEADELAVWEAGTAELDTVVDLLAWEDRRRA